MQTAVSPGEFRRYAAPGVLGMIGISCYILADTFFVAKGTGSLGLAALNIAIPAYNLMNGLGLMVGVGGATHYSLCRAQGDAVEADRTFTHTLLLGLCIALLFVLTGTFGVVPLSRLLGANAETLDMTAVYLRLLLCFAPFFVTNNVMIAFVRNDGEPGRAMAGMIAGSLFNIVFDWVFIFPCGLGMFGAALATGASPLISLLVLSGHLRRPSRGFHLRRERLRPRLLPRICAPGLSSLVSELASGITLLLINLVLLRIAGNTAVAAYGVIESCPRRDGHLHRPVHRRAAAHQPKRRSRPPPSAALDRHHRARHLGADVRPCFRVRLPHHRRVQQRARPDARGLCGPRPAHLLRRLSRRLHQHYRGRLLQRRRTGLARLYHLARSQHHCYPARAVRAERAARRHRRMADLPGGRGARLRTQSALYPAQSKITRKKFASVRFLCYNTHRDWC